MERGTVRMIAAAWIMIALAGCEAASHSPPAPGSVTFSMHGRVETGVSTSIR